ncbi:MAG: glycosyltransferase family 39 protein [Spirochaetia bacterium]|nr:glycosyltransferase family 39 protein [Spirochaetia bacterium]
MFNGSHIVAGIILLLTCAGCFVLAMTGVYMTIFGFMHRTAESLKKAAEQRRQKHEAAKKSVVPHAMAHVELPQPAAPARSFAVVVSDFFTKFREGVTLRIVIPKVAIFAVVAVLFVFAQMLFFQTNLKLALFILVTDILLLAATMMMKENTFSFELRLDNGFKVISAIAGAALIAAGWVLLISQKIPAQEVGVMLTIPGAVLGFLALPRMGKGIDEDAAKSDILFQKPDLLNNYFVKLGLILFAVIMLKIGIKVMKGTDNNMYSMIFYGLAIVSMFLALPLINYVPSPNRSRTLDYIKLAAVFGGMFLAYKGQQYFVKHDVDRAINMFIFAALTFIVAFPIYSNKETEEKEHFPVSIEVVFLVLITAVGAFLRLYELDIRPFGIENDEAGGLTSRLSRYGETIMPLTVGNFGIYEHIVRIFIALYGEMDRTGIRLMPAIVGIISIPAIYYFIRSMFNPRTAIFATTVYAFLRWNVYYSRYTSPVIMSICTETLALYFMFKAIESRKKLTWFIAGLCVGITWHGPMTFFLLIIPFVLYFIATAFTRKGYFKSNIVGIIAFSLGLWIFGSMIIHNYFISKRIYFGRVAEVSVFSKDPNAPSKNVAKGIVDNTRLVVQMFNHIGDSRQRNSGGQPLEPTVDFVTAILFGVGFLYALYYSKYYQFFIMLMVFFSQAAGSIFSIEAPSAMRAVGTMVPMLYFVAFTFDKIWLAFRRTFGKKFEALYLVPLMLVFLIPITKENYIQYFQRWISGLDELSTAAGMYSKQLGDNTRIVLYTSLYYPGHPPYKFFRWDYKVNSADRLTTGLVRLREVEDEDFAIFFHYDTWANIESVRQALFPNATITEVNHRTFNHKLKDNEEGLGTFVKVLRVTNADVQAIRGLTGVYSFGGQPRRNEDITFSDDDSSRMPYSATWNGNILIPYYGRFIFRNKGTASFTISIDGHKIPADGQVTLAEGFHKISVTAARNSPKDNIGLFMECRKLDGNTVTSFEKIEITRNYLYNFKYFGLHGYYYKGPSWTENPLRYEVISSNMCFSGGGILTESAVWKGTINIPASGKYSIYTRNNGFVRIILDGRDYWEQFAGGTETSERIERFYKGRNLTKVNSFVLGKGKHSIEIACMNTSLLELLWNTGPGEKPMPVPVTELEPDYKLTEN